MDVGVHLLEIRLMAMAAVCAYHAIVFFWASVAADDIRYQPAGELTLILIASMALMATQAA